MAGCAGRGETCGDVIGIGCSGEVCFVAGVAIRRRADEDVVDVAGCAGDCDVGASERERSVVVIEDSPRPGGCCMARGAGGRKFGGDVIGIGCSSEICLMTSVTISRDGFEVVVGMALSAGGR